MFEFNPDLVAQDDEGADGEALQFETTEEEVSLVAMET